MSIFPKCWETIPSFTARSNEALAVYCNITAQGFLHLEAENKASEISYQGLHFTRYDTHVSILKRVFAQELPELLSRRLVPMLLKNKMMQSVLDKHVTLQRNLAQSRP